MQAHLFEQCLVEYGDKKTRGKRITCGKCGSINRVPLNGGKTHGGGNDDLQMDRWAARKFAALGWRVATAPGQHRCPECVRVIKPFAKLKSLKESPEMASNGQTSHAAITAALEATPSSAPVTDAPQPMTREDGRVIYAKLNEVYQDERTGYSRDWSDKRVAEDLGVPRAWVVEVRDKWFGPDRNADFIESLAVAKAVIENCHKLAAEAQKFNERIIAEGKALHAKITPMLALVEKTERTVAAIEKAMVP